MNALIDPEGGRMLAEFAPALLLVVAFFAVFVLVVDMIGEHFERLEQHWKDRVDALAEEPRGYEMDSDCAPVLPGDAARLYCGSWTDLSHSRNKGLTINGVAK